MKDKFLEFAKTPLGTAIAIGLYALLIVIYIMSKTSFGKKLYNSAKLKVSYLVDEFKNHKEETKKEIAKYKEETEKKLAQYEQKINAYETFIVEVLSCINNKKVQERIKNFELSKLSSNDEKVAE